MTYSGIVSSPNHLSLVPSIKFKSLSDHLLTPHLQLLPPRSLTVRKPVFGLAVEQGARLETDLVAYRVDSVLSYETQGKLTATDPGKPLAILELKTSINSTWTLDGSGTDLATLSAALEIQFASSTVNSDQCYHWVAMALVEAERGRKRLNNPINWRHHRKPY